jgi:multidrug efflux system membrane fusion protein
MSFIHSALRRSFPGRPEAPAASVVAATSERRDVPVELKGIGIVQAFNTVTVKPRVIGQIMQVVFTEGQTVRQGEVLARIDSRFLIAQLHQAQATRAKDEAQLGQCEEGLGASDRRFRQGLCLPPARGRATRTGRHVGAAVHADQAVLRTHKSNSTTRL